MLLQRKRYVLPGCHRKSKPTYPIQNQAPAKTTAKATTSKRPAAPKKVAAVKKKATKTVLKEIHANGSDSESDADHRLTSTGMKNKGESDEENALPVHNKGKTAHEKYQVVSCMRRVKWTATYYDYSSTRSSTSLNVQTLMLAAWSLSDKACGSTTATASEWSSGDYSSSNK